MDKTATKTSAVERAERILSRRPAAPPPAPEAAQNPAPGEPAGAPVRRADAMLGHVGEVASGRGLVRATAFGYVALAAKVQALVDPVQQTWRRSLDEARRAREEQIARTQGPAAARQDAARERRGEKTLQGVASDAAEVAGDAGDAAGA